MSLHLRVTAPELAAKASPYCDPEKVAEAVELEVFDAEPWWTVGYVKALINKQHGIPVAQQRLLVAQALPFSPELKDEEPLSLAVTTCTNDVEFSLVIRSSEQQKWYRAAGFHSPKSLEHAPASVKDDKEVVLSALRLDGYALQYASDALRAERDVVLEAVKTSGGSLAYAHASLRADPEFVLSAVALSPGALTGCAEELRMDQEFVLRALEFKPTVGKCIPPEMLADRSFALRAAAIAGDVLECLPDELRADPEVVLTAMGADRKAGSECCSSALKFAAEALRQDRHFILQAMAFHGEGLEFVATPSLRADRDVVLVAVAQRGVAVRHADPELLTDRSVALTAVRESGDALQYLPEHQDDHEVVVTAARTAGHSFVYADEELQTNEALVLEMLETCSEEQALAAYPFVSAALRCDGRFRPLAEAALKAAPAAAGESSSAAAAACS
eukprot:TRINITY_DN70081_c0_g1_i1.p1 TRINITY_DN70081_c0_g1~~TRINITY_DN70081_c0_g1_i1.p1  ORF type:complete len:446 (+),score=106.44 TRINITY_DN70081_c0_g1_i1:151-1488(+)